MKAFNLPLADAEVNDFEDHYLSFSLFEQLAGGVAFGRRNIR